MIKTTNKLRRNKKVLHIDVPRALTSTVNMFDFNTAYDLNRIGIDYNQCDLNLHFWTWVFEHHETQLSLNDFFFPMVSKSKIDLLTKLLKEISETLDTRLLPSGFYFSKSVRDSTANLNGLIDNELLMTFFEDYLNNVSIKIKVNGYDLISFGVASASGLGIACVISELLRKRIKSLLSR